MGKLWIIDYVHKLTGKPDSITIAAKTLLDAVAEADRIGFKSVTAARMCQEGEPAA